MPFALRILENILAASLTESPPKIASGIFLFRPSSSGLNVRSPVLDIILNGLATEQYSPVSPANTLFYNSEIKKYPYEPKKAKSLLTSLGFFDKDKDGILEDNLGRKLEINFFTNADIFNGYFQFFLQSA